MDDFKIPKIDGVNDLWYVGGVILAALADHFIHNPISSLAACVVLLITWERYRSSKFKRLEAKSKADEAATSAEIQEIYLNRMKAGKKTGLRK